MRRLGAALAVAAALAAGCGGADEGGAPTPPATEPAPVSAAVAAAETGPTEEQLAVRKQLLAEIATGEYKCYCNAAMRARERIEKGLVKAPPRDAYVSDEP